MQTTEIDPVTAELLHAAVHELQGPAARLRLLAQLLARNSPALSDDARKLIGHIEASAAEAGAVADALRKYSEIGTRALQPERLDLNLLLGTATANLRREISSAGAQITSSKLPDVEGDRFLLTWLLEELLANAIRFGRPPEQSQESLRVHVSSGAEAEKWFLSVADNGRGIEP